MRRFGLGPPESAAGKKKTNKNKKQNKTTNFVSRPIRSLFLISRDRQRKTADYCAHVNKSRRLPTRAAESPRLEINKPTVVSPCGRCTHAYTARHLLTLAQDFKNSPVPYASMCILRPLQHFLLCVLRWRNYWDPLLK